VVSWGFIAATPRTTHHCANS